MLKAVLSAIASAIIFQTGAIAQVYVKNLGNVGIGVTNPSAKLDIVNNNNASLRVGVSSNMANTHSQLINSLAVIAEGGTGVASSGAVAHDFYNNGNSPSWSGALLQHYGNGLDEKELRYGMSAKNQGTLLFQNVRTGVIASNGAAIHIFPHNGTLTTPVASFMPNGNVGIGEASPSYKLHVVGTVMADTYIAVSPPDWPDYVFDTTYHPTALIDVEKYIQQNHHLPGVPSAEKVKTEGLNLGENQAVLLKKIEELTLYAIEQQKLIDELKSKMKEMEGRISDISR